MHRPAQKFIAVTSGLFAIASASAEVRTARSSPVIFTRTSAALRDQGQAVVMFLRKYLVGDDRIAAGAR